MKQAKHDNSKFVDQTKRSADHPNKPVRAVQALYTHHTCERTLDLMRTICGPVTVRSNPQLERAAELLAQALDRGFHDLIYPEHNRMADDPALAPLRQHPRVCDLLLHRSSP